MYPQLRENPSKQLKALQEGILKKLEKLSQLNVQYRNSQQRYFLKVFLTVMDKMSTELKTAEEQYRNIDEQVEKDKQCFELSTKLSFFKNQCLHLKKQLIQTQQQLEQEKKKQFSILKYKQQLETSLYKKSKQILRYKQKAKSLKVKTQHNQSIGTFSNTINEFKALSKNNSINDTKYTKNGQSNHIQKQSKISEQQQQTFSNKTRLQFRTKISKLTKQRKFTLSKSYYSTEKDKLHQRKNLTLQIVQ